MEELIQAFRLARDRANVAYAKLEGMSLELMLTCPSHEIWMQEGFTASEYELLFANIAEEHDFQEHGGDYFKWEALQLQRSQLG